MEYQAHRGVSAEFPENTMPAFEAAVVQGYHVIELDPAFTKDGKCVVLHDETLNRTCRNADGSMLAKDIRITDITYEQALYYDAGVAKAYKFRATKIPLLSEVLELVKQTDLTVKLDNRIQSFSEAQTEILFDTVEQSQAHVAFTSSDVAYIQKVLLRFPDADIHYDGAVHPKVLAALRTLVKEDRLTVWLPIQAPETSWVKVPTADPALCQTVRGYAKLGLWILSTPEQLEMARKYQADMVETAGQIKPEGRGSRLYDCHTHSFFSHDSACDPVDSLNTAAKCHLSGIAITDHCDIEFCQTDDVQTPVRKSADLAKKLGERVLAGVEIGEGIWYPHNTQEVVLSGDFDIVLGSVHAVRYKNYTIPYSKIDFSAFLPEEIDGFLNAYFDDMLEMIQTTDFDVLSHLTCPLRYICGKYQIPVDLNRYADKIESLLKEIITRGIALEVNTSCLGTAYPSLMPNEAFLKLYRRLGGYLITLGSDAHTANRVAYGFDDAKKVLSDLGFPHVYYYQKRKPIPQEYKQ